MAKEYSSEKKPVLPGDESYILEDGIIWFNEYSVSATKHGGIQVSPPRKKSRLKPSAVTKTELDVLIGTYIYTYVDKPGALSTHSTQLLSALLELKKLKDEG